MTLLLLSLVFATTGYLWRPSWPVLFVAAFALFAAALGATLGGAVSDSPVLFAAILAGACAAFGNAARRFKLWEIP